MTNPPNPANEGTEIMNVTDELFKALADPKPLYALAGAGDLAAEKVKSASTKGATSLLTDLSETVTALANRVAVEAPDRFAKVTAKLGEVPGGFDPKIVLDPKAAGESLRDAVGKPDVQALRDKAQTLALIQVGRVLEAAGKAVDTYDGLAERGRIVVDRYRGDSSREESVTVVVEQVIAEAEARAAQNHEIKLDVDSADLVDEAELADEPAAKPKPAAPKTAPTARKSTPRKRPANPQSTKD
jgi:heparin binding hemagglutinin HbhA